MTSFDYNQLPDIRYTLEYADLLTPHTWHNEVSTRPLSVTFIRAFYQHLHLPSVFQHTPLEEGELIPLLRQLGITPPFRESYPVYINRTPLYHGWAWRSIAIFQTLSLPFRLRYATYLPWRELTHNQTWNLEEVLACHQHINWEILLKTHPFPERELDIILDRFPTVLNPPTPTMSVTGGLTPPICLTQNILFCRITENPRTCVSTRWLRAHQAQLLFMNDIEDGITQYYSLGTSFDVDDWYNFYITLLRRVFQMNHLKRRWRRWAYRPGGVLYERHTRAVTTIIYTWRDYAYRPPYHIGTDMSKSTGGPMYKRAQRNFRDQVALLHKPPYLTETNSGKETASQEASQEGPPKKTYPPLE